MGHKLKYINLCNYNEVMYDWTVCRTDYYDHLYNFGAVISKVDHAFFFSFMYHTGAQGHACATRRIYIVLFVSHYPADRQLAAVVCLQM